MTLPEAIAAPRASQRNSATTQAEPAFIDQPTTPGLEALGQTFSVTDTSPLDPTRSQTIAPRPGSSSSGRSRPVSLRRRQCGGLAATR